MTDDPIPKGGFYFTPEEYHQEMLKLVETSEGRLWVLCVLCELFNQPLDLKFEPNKKGWTFRIGSVQPTSEGKLVWFSDIASTLIFAHRLLSEILSEGGGAVGE